MELREIARGVHACLQPDHVYTEARRGFERGLDVLETARSLDLRPYAGRRGVRAAPSWDRA